MEERETNQCAQAQEDKMKSEKGFSSEVQRIDERRAAGESLSYGLLPDLKKEEIRKTEWQKRDDAFFAALAEFKEKIKVLFPNTQWQECGGYPGIAEEILFEQEIGILLRFADAQQKKHRVVRWHGKLYYEEYRKDGGILFFKEA